MLRVFLIALCLSSLSLAESLKRQLNANSTVTFLETPQEVENLAEVLTEGQFYGRFRLNVFSFDWDDEVEGKTGDHQTLGVGGSIHYKSAYLNGIGFTAGLYTSQNPWHMDEENLKYYKVGKGVLNRHDVATKNKYGMTNLAVAYLELKNEKNAVKIGRQIVESYLTKSNDIKMIPNTFEGITWASKELEGHKLWAGYLVKQKLRDHNDFHHLFAYDDG
ncbi:MAG TPA: outer membrane porin, OprD family, partial [Campylobacterales bacterium]|nr:outer membrane porin, OprD family [Campylobacterales bacterium]